VRAFLELGRNSLGPYGESVVQLLADAACQFLPSAKVSDVLMGS
jgi:hypothetical protein